MLQPLPSERGTPGGGSDQEAARTLIGSGPDQIAHPLKPEDRVINVERQHAHAVRAVGRGGSNPGGECTGFGNPLLENLSVAHFAVVAQLVLVLRLVELAHRGVDADLPEQILHAKGTRLIGHDRHNACTDLSVLDELGQQANKHHCGGVLAISRSLGD